MKHIYPPRVSLALALIGFSALLQAGTAGDNNSASYPNAMSANGRFVAFDSHAANLVPGDTNVKRDVFRRDTLSGEIIRVSVSNTGQQSTADSYGWVTISADGNRVAFSTNAALVPEDTNGTGDIYVRDVNLSTTLLVSQTTTGSAGNSFSFNSVISSDGLVVAFVSAASDLIASDANGQNDVFVRDLTADTTSRVSVASDSTPANGVSDRPSINHDGTVVAFVSSASNLVAGDTNGLADVFVHVRTTGETRRISLSDSGVELSAASNYPYFSRNGRYVAYVTSAAVVTTDTNATNDLYRFDLVTSAVVPLSLTSTATFTTGTVSMTFNSLSYDGNLAAFQSNSATMVAGDTNGLPDIFVRDVLAGTTRRVNLTSTGAEAPASPSETSDMGPALSSDGLRIAYTTTRIMEPSDSGVSRDVYDADLATGFSFLPVHLSGLVLE